MRGNARTNTVRSVDGMPSSPSCSRMIAPGFARLTTLRAIVRALFGPSRPLTRST